MAKRLTEALPGSFPVFVKSAGLPVQMARATISPAALRHADEALPGAGPVCCRRLLRHHPEFIQLLNGVFVDCRPGRPDHPMKSVVCSPMDCVDVDGITVVGERINPTGKSGSSRPCGKGI